MKPYTVKQALNDALSLPPGKNLRLTFGTLRDAKVFRHGLIHARKRDRAARARTGAPHASPWDPLGTKLIRFPGSEMAQVEIGRWDGRKNAQRARAATPSKIEVADQERDTR